jgi:hypothetical protein
MMGVGDVRCNNGLYFPGVASYAWLVTSFSLIATYYYGFFGYNRWGPRSSVR